MHIPNKYGLIRRILGILETILRLVLMVLKILKDLG